MPSHSLNYDYDEFIRRLNSHGGCEIDRKVLRYPDGRIREVYSILYKGRRKTFAIGPGDEPLASREVESVVDQLGLSREHFGLPLVRAP